MHALDKLEKTIDYKFRNRNLLEEALVHSSVLNENNTPGIVSNERLEYLGDAVVGLIIAQELFQMLPKAPEGELTRLRSGLVCRATLGFLAKRIELGNYLLIGRGEEASGGRTKPANLARGLEALFGAVYLDGGIKEARKVALKLYGNELEELAHNQACADSKSQLQELTQSKNLGKPSYRIVSSEGPVHAPRFTAEVSIDNKLLATGKGKSKKLAEADAAFNAINILALQ